MSTYKVGRGKPPKHTRFKPGQSGNPTGRRKGSKNTKTVARDTFMLPVKIKLPNGHTAKVTTLEAVFRVLRERALRGERWAIVAFLALAERYVIESDLTSPRELSYQDQVIVDAYKAELRAEVLATILAPTPSQLAPESPRAGGQVKRRRVKDYE